MNFGGLDFAVLVLYMAGVTAWGAWLGRANRGGTDYFLGNRNLPWWAVMLSVVATETSTLTFLSIPGVAYLGTLAFLQLAIGYLAGRAVVSWILLPAYYRGELSTAYALLETRFGGSARRYASGIFMVTRLLADSVRLFATAIPLAIITGWSYPVSILVIGAATLAYTYYGGIRAVVWVDALQMALYVGGGLIALLLLHMAVDGGWSAILASAGSAGKMQVLDFTASPAVAYTFWAGLIGGGFLSMASHGTDQLIVQRLLTCRDVVQSRRALIGSGFAVIVQFALFLFVGLGLWVFFEGREFAGSDEIFARFIIEEMPAGVRGLLIAGVFAAAMSSLSSSINSLASASAYDFWGPLRRRRGGAGSTETGGDVAAAIVAEADRDIMIAGKVFTLVWAGLLIVGAIVFIPLSEGTAAVEVALAAASMAYGGLLGAFALGVLTRRVGQTGAIVGMTVGVGTVVVIWATARSAVAWPWFVLIGLVVTMVVGSAVRTRR
ncbi:MAG: sodium:solute symporter [Gemmatimonadota bacterium]|nr:sodium:solute symporter [Gemmatimonadota bacterium]MDE2986045.1 sodium:solute symporter [Gemmatimonadota bacterium]